MKPIFKEKIWGGRDLEKIFNKKLPKNKNIGEDWEVSDLKGNRSKVANGYLKGKTLHYVCRLWKEKILGNNPPDRFPVLIKFIDANQPLSVQVHPSDQYCRRYDPAHTGKKETWIVLGSKKNSEIFCGVKKKISKSYLKCMMEKKQGQMCIEKILKTYKIKKRNCVQINPGTLHSLKGGLVVLEVQQPSDATYRVHDYGRVDKNGRLRQIHLRQALDVVQLKPKNCLIKPALIEKQTWGTEEIITDEPEYKIKRLVVYNSLERKVDTRSFQVLCVIEGNICLEWEKGRVVLLRGDVCIVPAYISKFRIQNLKIRKSEVVIVERGNVG